MFIFILIINNFKSFKNFVYIGKTTEDMWTPYKELQNLVEKYVISGPNIQDPQYHELTEALRNHRQNFLTILKNPVSNIFYIVKFLYIIKLIFFNRLQ